MYIEIIEGLKCTFNVLTMLIFPVVGVENSYTTPTYPPVAHRK